MHNSMVTFPNISAIPAPLQATPAVLCDRSLDVELLMSTPHSVVVRARLQLQGEAQPRDLELVVPRRACQGNRPSGPALLDAARHGLRRLAGASRHGPRAAVLRLQACIGGRWQAILEQGHVPAVA